jgi:hypothetical protein
VPGTIEKSTLNVSQPTLPEEKSGGAAFCATAGAMDAIAIIATTTLPVKSFPPELNEHISLPSASTALRRMYAEKLSGPKVVDNMLSSPPKRAPPNPAPLSQAGAAATEMAGSASKQVTTFASEISKMTRDNPLGVLAGATMLGLLIGLLLHGRSNSK